MYYILYDSLVLLKRLDLGLTHYLRGYPFCGSDRRRDRGDVRHPILDGVLSYRGIVVLGLLTRGRVDQKLNLAVLDPVDDVRSSLVHLEHEFGLDAVLEQEPARALGSEDP